MPDEKLFHVGVKALIENSKKQILLLHADVSTHRKNTEPYWDIPGGRIKEGDSVLKTLGREVEEETGIKKISSVQFLTAVVSNHKIPISTTQMVGLLLMVYRIKIPEHSKVRISREHTAFQWVSREEAAKRLGHKYPKKFTNALLTGAAW
ncbi:MAG TPA: NUDIX hydrolase [Candidatus Saccharimonadales bacterium]|nr:NUDIX hydrolase [Candidatus Saccharimonadales bacterium]